MQREIRPTKHASNLSGRMCAPKPECECDVMHKLINYTIYD